MAKGKSKPTTPPPEPPPPAAPEPGLALDDLSQALQSLFTGGDDPYNRATYPWDDTGGKPDNALLADFKRFIKLRNDHPVLRRGSIDAPIYVDNNVIVLLRKLGDTYAITATNNSTDTRTVTFALSATPRELFDALDPTLQAIKGRDGTLTITVPAQMGRVLISR